MVVHGRHRVCEFGNNGSIVKLFRLKRYLNAPHSPFSIKNYAVDGLICDCTWVAEGDAPSRRAWMVLQPLEKSMNMILTAPVQAGVCTE